MIDFVAVTRLKFTSVPSILKSVFSLIGYTIASWVGVGYYYVNANGAQWRKPLAPQMILSSRSRSRGASSSQNLVSLGVLPVLSLVLCSQSFFSD